MSSIYYHSGHVQNDREENDPDRGIGVTLLLFWLRLLALFFGTGFQYSLFPQTRFMFFAEIYAQHKQDSYERQCDYAQNPWV